MSYFETQPELINLIENAAFEEHYEGHISRILNVLGWNGIDTVQKLRFLNVDEIRRFHYGKIGEGFKSVIIKAQQLIDDPREMERISKKRSMPDEMISDQFVKIKDISVIDIRNIQKADLVNDNTIFVVGILEQSNGSTKLIIKKAVDMHMTSTKKLVANPEKLRLLRITTVKE